MSASFEDAITTKVNLLSEAKQREVMNLIDGLLKEEQTGTEGRSIGEIFAELSAQVTLEEWNKLPSDGAEQHDHYLYGAPRKSNP